MKDFHATKKRLWQKHGAVKPSRGRPKWSIRHIVAIGFTEEHDLRLFTKRAKPLQLTLGGGDFHGQGVAKCMAF